MKERLQRCRFGTFELDPISGELRKSGLRIRIEDQPLRLLAALVARPAEVLTREELRAELWPEDTYVEFDRSLTRAINKVRVALGDSAANPRFIETLPRRGYRFVASVSAVPTTTDDASLPPRVPQGVNDAIVSPASPGIRSPWKIAGVLLVVAIAIGATVAF